jgi:hypothetical protein
MSEQAPITGGRPSIEERAAKRGQMDDAERDRYGRLVTTLRAGREAPLREAGTVKWEWHPIAGKMVLFVIAAAALYLVGSFGYNWFRDQQVETWTGPPAAVAVQSGQRLAGCPAANGLHDDIYPTWLRYEGGVYVLREVPRPVIGREPGTTGFQETGYASGELRLLTDRQSPDTVLVYKAGSEGARVYAKDKSCA